MTALFFLLKTVTRQRTSSVTASVGAVHQRGPMLPPAVLALPGPS